MKYCPILLKNIPGQLELDFHEDVKCVESACNFWDKDQENCFVVTTAEGERFGPLVEPTKIFIDAAKFAQEVAEKTLAEAQKAAAEKAKKKPAAPTKWYVVTRYYRDGRANAWVLSQGQLDGDPAWQPTGEDYEQFQDEFENKEEAKHFKREILKIGKGA